MGSDLSLGKRRGRQCCHWTLAAKGLMRLKALADILHHRLMGWLLTPTPHPQSGPYVTGGEDPRVSLM